MLELLDTEHDWVQSKPFGPPQPKNLTELSAEFNQNSDTLSLKDSLVGV